MKLSIIIPVYQVERYVEKCIRSVIEQDFDGDVECIIVDDCGTDCSMAIAEEVVNHYTGPILFQILHHGHNHGLSDARTTGLKVATGDYIWFVDSDDWLTNNALQTVFRALADNPGIDLIVTPIHNNCIPSGNNYNDYYAEKDYRVLSRDILSNNLFFMCPAQKYIINRCLFEDSSLFFPSGLLHEDVYFCAVLLYIANEAYVLSMPIYEYLQHPDSICGNRTIRNSYDLVSVHKLLLNYVDVRVDDKDKGWLLKYVFPCLLKSYSLVPYLFKTAAFKRFARKNGLYVWRQWLVVNTNASLKKKLGRFCFFRFPAFYRMISRDI